MSDGMKAVCVIISFYTVIGLIALGWLEVATRRISSRFKDVAVEVQAQVFTGRTMAYVLLGISMVIFWPAAIYGFLESRRSKNKHD